MDLEGAECGYGASLDRFHWLAREHYVVVRNDLCSTDDYAGESLERKELPSRRRLDCGKGVGLGSEDAAWLEQKDVPIDDESPGWQVFLVVSVSLLSLSCVYHVIRHLLRLNMTKVNTSTNRGSSYPCITRAKLNGDMLEA